MLPSKRTSTSRYIAINVGKSRPGINVILPEFTKSKDFKFGRATELGETVADIVYSILNQPPEEDAVHRQYILSHGSYHPGQRRAHYEPDWIAPVAKSEDLSRLNSDGNKVKELLYWKEERETYMAINTASLRLNSRL